MKKLMIRAVVLLSAFAVSIVTATAQVHQSGTVTPRHLTCWTTAGVIEDCGTAANPVATSFGTVGQGSTICANSAPITGPYNQLCIGANTASAAQITLQNYGGAAPQALQFSVNGVVSQFVTATGSFAANDVACFQSSLGVLLDCGMTVVSGVVSTGTWNATPIALSFGGTGATSASTARTSLGLGTIATQNSNAVAITGGTITGMPTPTNASDVAIKSYVDATSAGLHILSPSRLATAAVLPNAPTYSNGASGVGATLTAGSNTTLTVDSVVAALNDIVLVKTQASAFQNGIYYVSTAGSGAAAWVLTRCTAAACGTQFNNAATMLAGSYTFVSAGTVNANTSWVLSATVTTVGTDAASFYIFSNANSGVSSINAIGGVWTTTLPITNSSTALVFNATINPQGRLTLNSNTPVMTTSYSAQTAVFYTPYVGNLMPINDGTNIIPTAFSELTVNLGSNWTANTLNDWFVGSDSGTLRLCSGPGWSSSAAGSSSRGTGAGTTELARTAGMLFNANTMTCRYGNASTFSCAANLCTYVGTTITGSAGQINYTYGGIASGGLAGNFGLWNMYNRVGTSTFVGDTTDTWTYNSTTPRPCNNSATARVSYVSGFASDSINASTISSGTGDGSGNLPITGVGYNSTSAFSGLYGVGVNFTITGVNASAFSTTSLGWNFISCVEKTAASSSVTFFGDDGGIMQGGMIVNLQN